VIHFALVLGFSIFSTQDAAAKDSTIGGLGIYLTKKLTEDQEYDFV